MRRASMWLMLLTVACGGVTSPSPAMTRWTPEACLHDATCPFLMFGSHRGLCGDVEAPENSLASYLACAKAGSPMVEVDIRVTKDGAVVLHHDSDVLRVTDFEARFGTTKSPKVSDLTLAEFRALRMKDARCQGAEVDALRCQGATLDELIDATAESGLTFFIDYKAGDLTAFIADVQAKPGAARRMLFFDSSLETLSRIHAAVPELALMPRVQSADEARRLVASTTLPIGWIHGDPPYVKDLAPELKAKGIRLYANIWLLDAEFIAVITGSDADRTQAWERRVKPQLETLMREGVAGVGTEWSAPIIRGLYPQGWGVEPRR
jgi:glycerophosphoryl diester phosphodiesterase